MTILFLGFVHFVAFVTLHLSGVKNTGVFYLALFCFFSGIWMASESKLLLLFFNDPVVILNLALLSLFCLPVPLLLFVNRNYYLKYKKAINYVTLSYILFISVAVLLQLLNLYDFVLVLPIFHIISILAIIVVGFATLREMIRGNKRIRIFFSGCVIFSASILGDIALYYFAVLPQMGFHGFSLVGNLIFILITTSSLGENLFQIRDMQTRNRMLLSMAYTDGLTGLKNRTSFDEVVNKLNSRLELERSLHMIILDINNLKKINDTLGHREGDRLITDGAQILKRTLGKVGEIYRIGGDEFSIIVLNMGSAEINDIISELFEEIDHYNKHTSSFKISIAYGLASFKKGIDDDLNSVFVRADKAMYNCKVNQKQLQVID
jgi:diguanylate cyclase (GGDEF)-like protein